MQFPQADWQSKFDASKPCRDYFEQNKTKQAFRYKADDNDLTAKALQDNSPVKLYECDYNLPDNRFEVGEDSQENEFFAATVHVYDNQIKADSSQVVPQIPLFWSKDFNKDQVWSEFLDNYEPRILYFAGQRGGIDGTIRIFWGTGASEIELPACFAVNYNDNSGGLDPNLSYCNQTVNGATSQGLTEKYYIKSMARKRSARLRECYFYLNDIDIATLSFRPRIYLDGVWWLVREVLSYNPLSNQSTKVVLYLDEADNDSDYTQLTHSPILGVVNYFS